MRLTPNGLIDAYLSYCYRRERAAVHTRQRVRRGVWLGLATLLLAESVNAWTHYHDSPASIGLSVFAMAFVGGFAGVGVMSGVRRRQAFRNGWYEARCVVFDSMHEAMSGGMSMSDWLRMESTRDLVDLGTPLFTVGEPEQPGEP
jgi:hypothetical protein